MSGSVHSTNGGSGGMMSTAGLELSYLPYDAHYYTIRQAQQPINLITIGQDSIVLQHFEEGPKFETTRISVQLMACLLPWDKFCNFLIF